MPAFVPSLADITGLRVLVTGASGGIGGAAARAFAAHDARLAVHGHSRIDDARALAEEIRSAGGEAHAVGGDFTVMAEVEAAVDDATAALGGLDVLVNNAGTMVGRVGLDVMSDGDIERVLDLNARSVIVACRRAAPILRRSDAASIVNVSSISARTGGSAGSGLYSAAKAFVATFTRALATELAPAGIRVNAVSPGTIMTDFHRRYSTPAKLETTAKRIPLGRLGTAEDCAGAFLFLASPSMSGYVTGQVLEVNGGQLMP